MTSNNEPEVKTNQKQSTRPPSNGAIDDMAKKTEV
jgi:hypothetical protein